MRECARATISSPSLLLYTSLLLTLLLLVDRTSAYNTPSYAPFAGLPSLLPRQSVCSDAADSISCGVGGFCCPTDTRCIPVERNSSVVCCKIDEFCDEIFPVACGSATLAADSVQCGARCCPLGYDCGDTKDRCIMKAENLPADHIANRDSKKNQTAEAQREECMALLSLDESGVDGAQKKCSRISFEGILIGLFPGIAVGVAVMFAYIKSVEMKTRRRTIKFNGRLSASPDDLSFIDQKSPPVPTIREDIAIGYSPTAERAMMSPATFQRDWKARSPADYSPNLGPVIAPRERSVSRDRAAGEKRLGTPSPHPLAGSPLKPRPVYSPVHRASTGSDESSVTESETSTAVSQTVRASPGVTVVAGLGAYHRHLASDANSCITDGDEYDDDDGFSEVVIMDGTGDSLHHHSLSHREQERGRSRSRMSTDTGYTASVYQTPERYTLEPQIPPLNYRGSPRVESPRISEPNYGRF